MFAVMKSRYSVEFQVQSLFQDRTVPGVRIVNGVEKYVTETTETAEDEEHRASGKPIAKARPRMRLTPVYVPLRDRKWVDVNPGIHDRECYFISKELIRLQRHDPNIPRKTNGAVNYEDVVEEFNKRKKEKSLRNGHSMIGFQFWQKEEEPRKGFNIA